MKSKLPHAPRRPTKPRSPLHIADDWQWLEDIEDPETEAYLKAENAFYRKAMKPHAELQKSLLEELKARIAEDDSSVPEKDGEYWYYVRVEKGLQYPIYCRKKGGLDAPEEIYFDHNKVAARHKFCELGALDVSPNHEWLAYSLDLEGSERYTLFIRNLKTGEEIDPGITGISTCFEWKNNEGYFYIGLDNHDRPLSLHYRKMGQAESRLIYKEEDSRYFLGLDASESEEYLFLGCNGYDSNEVWFHNVHEATPDFRCFLPRRDDHEYDVTHHDESFLIVTNDRAVNFKLMKTPVTAIGPENWTPVYPYEPDVLIEGLTVFKDFWIVSERRQALPRLKVMPIRSGEEPFYLETDDEAYEIAVSEGKEYASASFRYIYSSPRVPQSLYEFDLASRERSLLKRRLIGSWPFDEENYRVKRLWAPARDGAKVPVTLIYHKDVKPEAPLILHGYGAYGETLDCDFSGYRLSLIDHGFIYGLAHTRGGMDVGRGWYLDGKLEKKRNTFTDFIDACEFLIREKWTRKGAIIAEGSSAGGMLMGVLANERPDLFLGIVASVPFVDVLNTMLDPTLPLTQLEYREWGDPNDPEAYARIKGYSPYDNVRHQAYPHMLVVAGLHDQRVAYWEAAKWVAKLRATKQDENLLLFKVEGESGHSGASGRYDALKETAEELTFMIMLKDAYLR